MKRIALALAALAAGALLFAAPAFAAGPGSTLPQAVHAFFADMKLQAAVVLIAVDFALGVIAALKHGTFRLSYVADFAKNDVLFKLVPWLALYVGAIYAGHQQLVIPGVDLGVAAGAAYALLVAAWAGSIANSLLELGIASRQAQSLKTAVAGPEKQPPPQA